MAANVKINVNLDAAKSITVASQLGTELAQASVNGANITVGNPAQVKATKDQAVVLNDIIKQIAISTERLNISLAKTAKLMVQANPNKFANSTQLMTQFDNIIAGSQKSIQQLQAQVIPATQAIQKPAEAATDAVKKTGKEAQKQSKVAIGAISDVGRTFKKEYNNFSAIANSFFSPITLAILAFEAVVKTFTYFWDNLTESIQKMTTRAQTAIRAIQRKQKALQQETKTSKDLIKQLEDLNKQQNLSIDQQRVAESIIAKLNKQYKDLGITLDETTGKYEGLYEAQRKIDQQNRREQANALRKQMQAQRDVVNASLANTFGRGINLDKDVIGDDFFSLAEGLGKTLGAQNADLLAKKWNTHDLQKQLEVIDQLIQGLSSSDKVLKNGPEAREALATLIDYRKQLQELNSVDNLIIEANRRLAESFKEQADALKKTKDEIEGLNKSFEQQQRANSLAGLDPEDRANALRGEVEQLEKRNQLLQQAQEYGQKQANGKRQNSKQALKWLEEYQNGMKSSEEAMNNAQKKMDENKKQIANLLEKYRNADKEATTQVGDVFVDDPVLRQKANQIQASINKKLEQNKKLQEEVTSAQKQLNGFKKAAEDLEVEYQKQNGITLQHEQALANIEKQRQQNLNKIQEKEQQIASIEKQIAEQRAQEEQKQAEALQKQADAIDAIYKSYQKQLEAQNKTPLEQKLEDAFAAAEKAKGAPLSEDQIEQIRFYVTQLERMNELEKQRQQIKKQQEAIEGVFTGYQEKQTEEYLKLVGKQKQSLLLEARLNAEKAKGAELTEQELESLKAYVETDQLLNEFKDNQKLNVGKENIITNELASKGGFASSIVVDRSVEVNEQILQVQKSQKELMNKINQKIEKYSVIQ